MEGTGRALASSGESRGTSFVGPPPSTHLFGSLKKKIIFLYPPLRRAKAARRDFFEERKLVPEGPGTGPP